MKLRGLIIAMVVLAALMGALYWSSRHPKSESSEASGNVSPKILTLKEDDVSKIDLKKKGANELVLTKSSSGKWQITAPKPLGADQSAVSGVVGTLSSLSSERVVEEKASDLKPYGLADPALEIDVTAKDNQSHRVLFGDNTPTGNAVYARLEGDPQVFTIPSYEKTSIDKSLNDLRDKRLLTADAEKISRVELIAKKQDLEFGRNKNQWQILKPKPLRADSTQVENLVRALTEAKMDLGGLDDAKKIALAFASATPVATAKMTAESGTQQLEVRKTKDDYYARSSAVEGVYKVTSSLGQSLDKGLDDFRNKKLFDFGFSDPNKIEVHDGSKSYFLAKGGEDWWNGSSQRMDMSSAQSLVDKIRDLSASKFVDSGFTTPSIELAVTSNEGNRAEKVLIAKSGDNYVAKRENEPALYELDAKSVTALEKSAEELKTAAPPANPAKPSK